LFFADQSTPIRPDPKLTPGATFDVTLQDISEPGYSKKVRNVTAELKREVYAEYGITEHQPGEYEVDHLTCAFDRRLQFNQKSLWKLKARPDNPISLDLVNQAAYQELDPSLLQRVTAGEGLAQGWKELLLARQKHQKRTGNVGSA
jgi:hypothetical protein